MAKIKVGELFGKPIVWGNPNHFEKYEIPLNDLLEGKLKLKDVKND